MLSDEYISIENAYLVGLANNSVDVDSRFGLFSVFDNEEKFKANSENLQNINEDHLLFTKNHKLKNYKNGELVINTKSEFEKYFDIVTNNVFLCMDWNNVLMAGGSILSILSSVPEEYKTSDEKIQEWFKKDGNFGDIDIFLYGLNDRQATKKIFEIYESIKNVIPKDILCVRGPRAITFTIGNPYRHIQIILRNFKSVSEILMSFDVDSCAFGYDGDKVWCSDRSYNAITKAINVVKIDKRSQSYEYRLAKYGKRGYAVYVPGFTEDNLNEQIYLKPPHQLKGLAKLLVLEKLDDNVKYQIYRDVLDMHQASMRKNLNQKSEYEDSDYSKIYLPDWTEEFKLDDVKAIMKKKFEQLNKGSEFEKHYCFYGKLNDVIMGKSIRLPNFESKEQRQNYDRSYVYGRLKFHSITDKDFKETGVFNSSSMEVNEQDITEWYQTAYHPNMNKNTIIEYVTTNQPHKIIELLESGKNGKTEEEYKIWRRNILNSKDIANRVPLHQAIYMQDEIMVFLLLECGADITYVSKLGKSALHTSCEVGNIKIVKMLIESEQIKNNSDLINLQDSYKLTPILYSLMYGNTDVFKYMFKLVDKKDLVWIFKFDKNKNYRALKMCLMFRQYDIAKFLLEKGYDINDYYEKRIVSGKKISRHILEDCVISYDHEMFNIIMSYHNNSEDSGLKYQLDNLQYLSKDLQQKYNKARTKQSRDYYCHFITKLYEIHNNKNSLYDLLSSMIIYHRFEDFKEYVTKNNVNLSVINNGESLLDNVENKINWLKTNMSTNKANIKILQQSQQNKVTYKYQYSTGFIQSENDQIYVIPSWIVENEISYVMNSLKINTSKKSQITSLEEQLKEMAKNLEYYDEAKKYLTSKGVVSMITKKSKSLREYNSDEDSTKKSKNNNIVTQTIDISVMSSKKVNVADQQTYLELFSDINAGSNLDEYDLDEFDLECYLSKSQLTPLQVSLIYDNFEAFSAILKHIIKNKRPSPEKKRKIVKNNLKLKKMISNGKRDDSDEDNEESQKIQYNIDYTKILDGLIKVISENESELALTMLLSELHEEKEFCDVLKKKFWTYIKKFIECDSYKLINVLVNFYDEKKELMSINHDSVTIINNVFANSDLEAIVTFFKAIKNKMTFDNDIFYKYIEYLKSNNVNVSKSKQVQKIIKLLLELQSTILNSNVGNTEYSYPINFAMTCSENLFSLVLQYSPDVNVCNSDGYYPIHIGVMNNRVDNVKLLLEKFPEQINKGSLGQNKTPLMLSSTQYSSMIDTLLKFNPNQNSVDVFGNTPLHYATIKANIYLVSNLEFHNKENYMRMTPSDYIINNYKSYFHHIRNEKLGLQLDKKKLSFIVEIYKKYVSTQNKHNRELANYSDVIKVNKYILNSIPNNTHGIPKILTV